MDRVEKVRKAINSLFLFHVEMGFVFWVECSEVGMENLQSALEKQEIYIAPRRYYSNDNTLNNRYVIDLE